MGLMAVVLVLVLLKVIFWALLKYLFKRALKQMQGGFNSFWGVLKKQVWDFLRFSYGVPRDFPHEANTSTFLTREAL